MKKLILSLTIISSILTSCSVKDEETTTTQTPQSPQVGSGVITGDITANRTYTYGNYTLKGMVKVQPGATLTFEAGCTITCDKSTGENGIVVLNGGKLIANGTASSPIVFTEKSKIGGSWAGIIMYGDAPIVNSATVAAPQTSTSEDGLGIVYGGSNPAHDGGSLKFVRVEYAGQVITSNNKEHNGFSFYAVGSGTVLENLVSYMGNDDGFEFYGGTVSLKNAVSYGNLDDSFDWQDGWRGQANSNWFAYQTGSGNYGMEIEAKGVNNAFWPVVSGITLKRAAGTTTEAQGEIQLDAIQFKSQGNGEYNNIVIDGYKNQTTPSALNGGAIQVRDLNTFNNQVTGGKIKITNVKITNTDNNFISGANTFTLSATSFNPASNWSTNNAATGATLTGGAWATVGTVNLLSNL